MLILRKALKATKQGDKVLNFGNLVPESGPTFSAVLSIAGTVSTLKTFSCSSGSWTYNVLIWPGPQRLMEKAGSSSCPTTTFLSIFKAVFHHSLLS